MRKAKQHKKQHLVYLGENGFPKGLAAIQRMTLIGRSLLLEAFNVTVVCRKGVWLSDEGLSEKTSGNYEGIDYRYTTKSVFKPEGFIRRNIQKVKGLLQEYQYLRMLKKQGNLDVAIVSNMNAIHKLRYCIYASWLNFPVVLNFVEMNSSIPDGKSFLTKFIDRIFDQWIIKLFDGALPISDKLLVHYNLIAPTKPSLKLPILCDFEKFNLKPHKVESYFLYCGSIAYKEVINFVLKSYNNIDQKGNTKLYMIISGGSKEETKQLEKRMNETCKNNSVQLFANIPYSQLVHLYTNAVALLIPLRPTVQDTARFPHKIGEYLASGNPVITTAVGEIKNYFKENETALIANSYEVAAFSEKMQYVLNNPKKAQQIGANGKVLGLREFDFRTKSKQLKKFLGEVTKSK